jgi:hypothetical protein
MEEGVIGDTHAFTELGQLSPDLVTAFVGSLLLQMKDYSMV